MSKKVLSGSILQRFMISPGYVRDGRRLTRYTLSIFISHRKLSSFKGMIKMYIAEVLSKVPVVQHFPFGSLFSWEQDPNAVPPTTSIHASSQPTRTETGSTSFNVVSMRVSAQESTRSPREPMHAALPDPVRETRAPWASKQPLIIPSTSDAASSAPSVRRESGRTKPPPALIQDMASTRPPNGAGSSQDVKTSMPPPTKAPWAK